tara:strand:+ start:3248 stop:3427 length:180 start_codon:yes stop_codon:yes gene_type:complete
MDEKQKNLFERLLKREINKLTEEINFVTTSWIEERLTEERDLCYKTLEDIKKTLKLLKP